MDALTKPLSGLRDPLFLGCCALYVMNRFLIKPHMAGGFFHNWFNDLLLVPCALPILLAVHRALGLRQHDGPPTAVEVFSHLVGWTILVEIIGSRLLHRGTGDPFDVLAYAIGALAAMLWWRHESNLQGSAPTGVRMALKTRQCAPKNLRAWLLEHSGDDRCGNIQDADPEYEPHLPTLG